MGSHPLPAKAKLSKLKWKGRHLFRPIPSHTSLAIAFVLSFLQFPTSEAPTQQRWSLLVWLHTRGNARGLSSFTAHCSGGNSSSWTLSATETGHNLKEHGRHSNHNTYRGRWLFTKMAQPCGQAKPREADVSTLEITSEHLGPRAPSNKKLNKERGPKTRG